MDATRLRGPAAAYIISVVPVLVLLLLLCYSSQDTMAIQGQALCILMTITCGLSYLLYGYDQGFMSGVLYATVLFCAILSTI